MDLGQMLSDGASTTKRPPYQTFADYMAGRHQLKFASQQFETQYGNLLTSLRENLCPAVVETFTDMLAVESWGSESSDTAAADLGLTRVAGLATTQAFTAGDAYVMVWPNRAGKPVPYYQTAGACVPYVDPDDPSKLAMLGKRWIDNQRYGRAMLLYPDRMERYRTASPLAEGDNNLPIDLKAWVEYTEDGNPSVLPNTVRPGLVPAVWLRLGASTPDGYGRSILTDVVPLQDALNKGVADLIVLSEMYSRPFWYLLKRRAQAVGDALNPFAQASTPLSALGSETTAQPQSLSPNPGGISGRFNRLRQTIFTTDAEGPFGQLDPPDATKLIEIHSEYKTKVAGVVGMPMFYLTQVSTDAPSGASLRVLSQRATNRARGFQRDNTPALKGLAELLGLPDPVIGWAPVSALDPTEVWQIAETQYAMGMDIEDVLREAGMPDHVKVAARAKAAAAERSAAQRMGLLL